jgi:hypothetical protein
MGSAIAIVNGGDVDIEMTTAMDETKMQEVINQILVTTQDFKYVSKASSISEMTFNNLTATQSLTVEQGGGYQFQALASATVIDMGDAFKSSVTKVDFRALTSVTRFETENTADEIRFTKAMECHLTELVYYPGTSLTIVLDDGAALPLKFDDQDANGDQANKTLSITGPSAVTIETWLDGTLNFTDVPTVVVNGFEGTINTNTGVESLSANKYAIAGTLGADLESITLTGITDPDTATDVTGPAFALDDQTRLETLTLSGKFLSINVEGCTKLTTATISADVAGSIVMGDGDAAANGLADLTTLTLTGAKASSIEASNNGSLESLVIDATIRLAKGKTALDGTIEVIDNVRLETLTVSTDKLEKLTVTGNDDLTTVDFTGVTTFGATGKPNVKIYDNDLVATTGVDTVDTTATADGASASDLGAYTSSSGMKTLKTYLAACAADADTTAAVYFDTVESYTNESATEATDQTWGATPDAATKILVKSAETTAAKGATKAKVAYKLSGVSAGNNIQFTVNGQNLLASSVAQTYLSGNLILSGNQTIDIARITDAAFLTNATANDVTLTAYAGGNDTFVVSIIDHNAITQSGGTFGNGERYSTAAALSGAVSSASVAAGTSVGGIGTDDIITLTIGSNTMTATLAQSINNATSGQASVIATAINTAWGAKYGASGTNSTQAEATIAITGERQLTITPLDPGSRGHNIAVSFSIANSTSGPTSLTHKTGTYDYMLGTTISTADNTVLSNDVIVALESNVAGTILNKVKLNKTGAGAGNYGLSFVGLTATTLVASKNTTNAADVLAGSQGARIESRSDVRPAEAGLPGSGDAANYTRVHWLAD